MKAKFTTIDEHLAAVSDAQRASLERRREILRGAAPRAEDCIGNRIPAFRQNRLLGRIVGPSGRHWAIGRPLG